jgi:hypothetical protein
MVPDPQLAPLVEQAFELGAFMNHKIGEVLVRMTAQGLHTRRGKRKIQFSMEQRTGSRL